MKITMRVAISGSRNGDSWPAVGGEIVVSDLEGKELCAAGYAVPVAVPAKAETRVGERGPEIVNLPRGAKVPKAVAKKTEKR